MKHLTLCMVLVCLISSVAISQTDPLMKKLDHARELYSGGKPEKAESYLEAFLEDHPDHGKGWDLLVAMRKQDYARSKELRLEGLFSNLVITTKDKDGKEIPADQDTTAARLKALMSEISPGEQARQKYLYFLRQALAHSNEAVGASAMFRIENVDVDVDSNINRKALRYYEEGEKEFTNRNYQAAAKHYRRALEEQPGFYKAKMYLGDAWYGSENYAEAAETFKSCISLYPDLLEPRKYLTDAYAKMHLYEQSLEAAIAAMAVYPDCSMTMKLDDAAYLSNKQVDIRFTARGALPLEPGSPLLEKSLNAYRPADRKIDGPWIHYDAAAATLKDRYNGSGILKNDADGTAERYLDVQRWSEMLRKSSDVTLAEARRMQQAGYLDCYVLVTCYHPDIYPQYRHFAANNSDKIKRYYQKFLKDRS
jgi:tetratricopeptide (TPR) repeat protein